MGLAFGKIYYWFYFLYYECLHTWYTILSFANTYYIYVKYVVSGLEKGECTEENLQKAKLMVPKSLEKYVERMLPIYIFFFVYRFKF